MSFKLVSAIIRSPWLIEPETARSYFPLIKNLLDGTATGFDISKQNINLSSVSSGKVMVHSGRDNDPYDNISKFAEGSILIIPFSGPVMKDDNCGDLGTESYANLINRASKASNIAGVFLCIDSPGGQAYGTQLMVDAIKNCEVPIVGYVNDGYAASAAYWIASACDELYVSHETSKVGSIGGLVEIRDWNAYYASQGLKTHTIYAPQSSEKNKSYNDALAGDYSLMKEDLKVLVNQFITSVKDSRSEKLDLSKGDPFKGAMFFAKEAQAIGLIDGICSINDAIDRCEALIDTSKKPNDPNNSNNSNNSNMNKKSFSAINAVLGVTSLETTDEGVFLNEDQMNAIETGLAVDETLVTAEDYQTTVTELETANTTISASETNLRTIAIAVGADVAEGDFDAAAVTTSIEAKITELSSSSAAQHSGTGAEGDDHATAGGDDAMSALDGMSHNQDADNL